MNFSRPRSTVTGMKPRAAFISLVIASALIYAADLAAQPPSATAAFDSYARSVEAHLATQHSTPNRFLALASSARPPQAAPLIEHLAILHPPGALIHHWRATQFVPGASAEDLDRLLRNFSGYPALFAPQVERAVATSSSRNCFQLQMRVRQHHVLAVVLDTAYDVSFSHLDPQHRYSASRSTRIREIASPGTSAEHALPAGQDHGFLWRQNTYWSWEQHDGGLYIQIESISFTHSVPTGLGWAIGPYIESIPRESLEFTLHCISTALRPLGPSA